MGGAQSGCGDILEDSLVLSSEDSLFLSDEQPVLYGEGAAHQHREPWFGGPGQDQQSDADKCVASVERVWNERIRPTDDPSRCPDSSTPGMTPNVAGRPKSKRLTKYDEGKAKK